MTFFLTYIQTFSFRVLGGILMIFLTLNACSKKPDEIKSGIYNQISCECGGVDSVGVLKAIVEGKEEKLDSFYRILDERFGKPKVTFLNFTLETFSEFFEPEKRKIDPAILVSPYGIQKILVWDSLALDRSKDNLVKLSIQVEQKRSGSRVIDLPYSEIQVRAISLKGQIITGDCEMSKQLHGVLQKMMLMALGSPHNGKKDKNFLALEAEYERKKDEWCDRVWPVLNGSCYPPVSHIQGTNYMRIQLCEQEGMTDTLTGKLIALDSQGNEVDFILADILKEKLTDEIRIYKGYLEYSLLSNEIDRINEIRILFPDGNHILIYHRNDFIREPLPFKRKPLLEELENPERKKKRRANRLKT